MEYRVEQREWYRRFGLSVEGRKEVKGEERKGKAIWPFVAEERRVKRLGT